MGKHVTIGNYKYDKWGLAVGVLTIPASCTFFNAVRKAVLPGRTGLIIELGLLATKYAVVDRGFQCGYWAGTRMRKMSDEIMDAMTRDDFDEEETVEEE